MIKKAFLYLFYEFLRLLCHTVNTVFFKKLTLQGKAYLHTPAPVIVACNHPNAFIDVSIIGAYYPRQLFMLANAGLFKTRFTHWFLNTFYCIPIERPQDTDGRPVNNTENFRRSTAHLARGGNIFIAPEGTSLFDRRIKPLKTGLARIALSAEDTHHYTLGLQILPMAINYQAATDFDKEVVWNIGAPIRVADFKDLNTTHHRQAVDALTLQVEDAMISLAIHTASEAEHQWLLQLENILRTTAPLSGAADYARSKQIVKMLRGLTDGMYAHWHQETQLYFGELEKAGISDKAVATYPTEWLRNLTYVCLSAPLAVLGLLTNAPPAWAVQALVRKLRQHPVYTATIKGVGGLVFFFFYYLVSFLIIYKIFLYKFALIYLLIVIPLGKWTWRWYQRVWLLRQQWRLKTQVSKERNATLLRLRESIVNWLQHELA